jgi:beta-lactamase class A
LSQNLRMPVDQLPHYITQEKFKAGESERRNRRCKNKKLQVLEHYNVTMNDLEEYRRNKPLVETIKSQQNKLEKAKRQIDYLEKELSNERFKNFEFEYSRLIPEYQLKQANKILDRPIEPGELREIADEIYHKPGEYADIIALIRKHRHSSLNTDKIG